MRSCAGSPAVRHLMGSVFFLRAPIFLRPATGFPSSTTWNLNVRYGSKRWAFAGNKGAGIENLPSLLLQRLLDAHDNELGRLERRKSDHDDHLSAIDVVLGHRIAEPTTNEVGVTGLLALERTRAEQAIHERADIDPQRGPQAVFVGLEHRPLDSVVDALLDHDGGASHRHVPPGRIGPGGQRACAPDHRAEAGQLAKA